jgi:hypothetical protein
MQAVFQALRKWPPGLEISTTPSHECPLSDSDFLGASEVVPRAVELKKCERIFSKSDSSTTI